MAPLPAGRPVPWVSPLLYAAVLASGLYHGTVVAADPPGPGRLAGFTAVLALLFLLEPLERRSHRTHTQAALLLAVRLALFVAVTALDGSGLARILYLLVPFTAFFAFGRRVAITLGVACVGVLITGYALTEPRWYADAEYISDLLMFGLGLVLALSMAQVAVGEREARVRLADYAERVGELSAATERNRLAREIHDSLGHHLTAIAIQLEKAEAFADRDAAVAARALADARWSADRALEEVRQSVGALREGFSLSSALSDLVRHVGDLGVALEVSGREDGYDTGTLTALYRAAQEGLTNARRHAAASRVSVSLTFDADDARLVIADDGRGFSPAAPSSGTGLRGMRERVRSLGGGVDVDSRPEEGTTITVTVPRAAR